MLNVDIADTPSALERGLMFVESMPPDHGMLFVFKKPHKLSFWGQNTFIPLDIAFIDRNNTIQKISTIKPFSLQQVSSDNECIMAIEANAGFFEQHNISVGHNVDIDTDDWQRSATIDFRMNKESQTVDPFSQTNQTPQPNPFSDEQVPNEGNLPVFTADDIEKILEDSFDEPETPEEAPQQPEIPEDIIEEPQKEYPSFTSVFDAVDWAEKNREVVRINYTTRHGRQLTRDVEPHGQFHASTTMHQILVCWDETVGEIRAFILTNIQNWSFIGKDFQKKFIVRG